MHSLNNYSSRLFVGISSLPWLIPLYYKNHIMSAQKYLASIIFVANGQEMVEMNWTRTHFYRWECFFFVHSNETRSSCGTFSFIGFGFIFVFRMFWRARRAFNDYQTSSRHFFFRYLFAMKHIFFFCSFNTFTAFNIFSNVQLNAICIRSHTHYSKLVSQRIEVFTIFGLSSDFPL